MFKPGILFITTLCGIFCSTWGQQDKIMVYLSPSLVIDLRKCAESCGPQHGVDPKDLQKNIDGTFPDDEPHRQFLYCTMIKCKYVNDDGHININQLVKLVPLNGTQEDVKQVIDDCNKTTGKNVQDTAFTMDKCYHQHFTVTLQRAAA